jgi:hypothetical protein
VAVLKLDRPIQYAPHIVPICLPQKNEFVSEGTEAMVSGKLKNLYLKQNLKYRVILHKFDEKVNKS